MCWPKPTWAARAETRIYQFILVEAMEYWRMPYGNLTFTSIAPSIAQYGTELAEAEAYLPGIWNGDLTFAIGYSEPNAGTDLAALRTKGEKVDGGWKCERPEDLDVARRGLDADLACDPHRPGCEEARRHLGADRPDRFAPGVTIRPLKTMSGMTTYETFYDDVFVPDRGRAPAAPRRLADHHARPQPRARGALADEQPGAQLRRGRRAR